MSIKGVTEGNDWGGREFESRNPRGVKMSSQPKLLCNKKDVEGRAVTVAKIDEADKRVKGDIKNLASYSSVRGESLTHVSF